MPITMHRQDEDAVKDDELGRKITMQLHNQKILDITENAKPVILQRLKTEKWLASIGETLGGKKQYSIDFIAKHTPTSSIRFLEAEVRYNKFGKRPCWEGKIFNYSTIHVPQRKSSKIDPGVNFFVACNPNTSSLYLIDSVHCVDMVLVTVGAETLRKGQKERKENFFDVPINDAHYVDLDNIDYGAICKYLKLT